MSRDQCDVLVVGAGLAGLEVARRLAARGLVVSLVDQKASPGDRVRTTGIFVKQTLSDFDIPLQFLGPPVRSVVLHSPWLRSIRFDSPDDEFRVGQMRQLYEHYRRECERAGVEFRPSTRFQAICGDWIELQERSRPYRMRARYVIGADGARSRVAAVLGLSRNAEMIVGIEEILPLRSRGQPRLECYLDPDLAPGYIGWLVDDGSGEIHVGIGGYADRFVPRSALASLKRRIGLSAGPPLERRSGLIPVGGVLANIANQRGLLVGDAAGAVSPLTAGGFDPCFRLAAVAAEATASWLTFGDGSAITQYSGARIPLHTRVVLRRLFALIRSRVIVEAACGAMRLPILHGLAHQVFFGRGSFAKAISIAYPSQLKSYGSRLS